MFHLSSEVTVVDRFSEWMDITASWQQCHGIQVVTAELGCNTDFWCAGVADGASDVEAFAAVRKAKDNF